MPTSSVHNHRRRQHLPKQSWKLLRFSAKKLDRFKSPIMNVKDPPNIERLIIGCIEANICEERLNVQHFPRSTRSAHFCTAQSEKVYEKCVRRTAKFASTFDSKVFTNFYELSHISLEKSNTFSFALIFIKEFPGMSRISSNFRRYHQNLL